MQLAKKLRKIRRPWGSFLFCQNIKSEGVLIIERQCLVQDLFEKPPIDPVNCAGFEILHRYENGYNADFMGYQVLLNSEDLSILRALAVMALENGAKNPAGIPFSELHKQKVNKEKWWKKQWNTWDLNTSHDDIANRSGCADIFESFKRLCNVSVNVNCDSRTKNYCFGIIKECTGTRENLKITFYPIVFELIFGSWGGEKN